MKVKKILKLLVSQKKIKITEEQFNKLEASCTNSFVVYQIESDSVNIYSEENGETYYDIPFEAILKPKAVETKLFRVTYRSEIYINATDFRDTKEKFSSLSKEQLNEDNDFIEIVSVEDENNNEESN